MGRLFFCIFQGLGFGVQLLVHGSGSGFSFWFMVLVRGSGFGSRFWVQGSPANLFSQTLYTLLAMDYITSKQTTRRAIKQDGMGRKKPAYAQNPDTSPCKWD